MGNVILQMKEGRWQKLTELLIHIPDVQHHTHVLQQV